MVSVGYEGMSKVSNLLSKYPEEKKKIAIKNNQ